jgi:hypothetical protein
MKTYKVYYTKSIEGSIDVEAKSKEHAISMVEDGGDIDFGNACEYDESIEAYDAEKI